MTLVCERLFTGARRSRALSVLARKPAQGKNSSATRLEDAIQALKCASTPLLQNLDLEMGSAARGDDPA